MSHSYGSNVVHIVFSTKNREGTIAAELRPRLWAYMAGICRAQGMFVYAVGGTEDHVHVLAGIPLTMAVSKAVLTLKANSSRWVNAEGWSFSWQRGYAAFSVSASVIPTVVRYIQEQEAHHRRKSFETEFTALLRKHGVEFDPAFVMG